MQIFYFILCMFGGAFVVLIPWMGVMFAVFSGTPKTAKEGAIQAQKQASEHPSHAQAILHNEANRQQEADKG